MPTSGRPSEESGTIPVRRRPLQFWTGRHQGLGRELKPQPGAIKHMVIPASFQSMVLHRGAKTKFPAARPGTVFFQARFYRRAALRQSGPSIQSAAQIAGIESQRFTDVGEGEDPTFRVACIHPIMRLFERSSLLARTAARIFGKT